MSRPIHKKRVRRAKQPDDPFVVHEREVFSTDEHFRTTFGAYLETLRVTGKRFNKSELLRKLLLEAVAIRRNDDLKRLTQEYFSLFWQVQDTHVAPRHGSLFKDCREEKCVKLREALGEKRVQARAAIKLRAANGC